ncbi:MAG: hypothetical protein QM737_20805 [Ferruginibacter sp.]
MKSLMSYRKGYVLPVFVLSLFIVSCGGDKEEKPVTPPVILRKDTATHKKNDETLQAAPIINITDTIALKANVIYIKDSAATSFRLSQKLGQIYGTKLQAVIKQNKLKLTGAPIAWYRTQKAPFFFEAGLPVDKKPAKLAKGILFKTIGGDSAVVAHFYGPYERTTVAYEALNDFLKDRNKKSKAPAYEIYITDPIDKTGKPVDPYKVQTDIVIPHN